MHDDISFGHWVRQLRRAHDLTQEALAERVGYAAQTIRKIESGGRRPSREMAEQLAQALLLPPEQIPAFMRAARAPVGTVGESPQPAAPTSAVDGTEATEGATEQSTVIAALLPSGTVTFFFTDIVGSTQLWEQHPQAMPHALARHDAILREAITTYAGMIFRTVGDGVCAAFASAAYALAATLAAQRMLHSEPWGATGLPPGEAEPPLRVRMALHTGVVEVCDGDYMGPSLNRVARILASGHGGQILLSHATYNLVVEHLPSGAALRDLGEYRLRGLSQPERIFQLVAPDLPADFPRLRTQDTRPVHLPIPATPLIGRETELRELTRLLADPACRLITLAGPGGIGKTRLALQVATDNAARFVDGVYFVSLASVNTTAALGPAISVALAFTFQSAADLKEQLLGYLREKNLLLVLDNMEHLLDEIELPVEIMQRSSGVKLLVTSRERLKVQGEWVIQLQGLSVPKGERTREVAGVGAVALFLQCAQHAQRSFALAKTNQQHVVHICRFLEGMPLGIELAAAWVHVLSCSEIVQELERNMDFLAVSARDLPARHRSLRAVFEHSWNLLNQAERHALRRLSVFRGGFTRAAAASVVLSSELNVLNSEQAISKLKTQNSELLTLLSALVDKSLLRRTAAGRYDMHELIRQYVAMKLEEDPREYELARDQHSAYYMALLRDSEQPLKSARQQAAIGELSAEINNLRLAWQSAISGGNVAAIRQAAFPLGWFYELRTWFQEAELLFQSAIEQLQMQAGATTETERAELIGFLMSMDGWFCFRTGRPEQAHELLHRGLALLRAHDDREALYYTLVWLGFITHLMGDNHTGRELLEESLALAKVLGNQWKIALMLAMLGVVTLAQGEYQEARRLLGDSLRVGRTVGDRRLIAFTLNYLSAACLALGAYAETQPLLHECIALSGEYGDHWVMAAALNRLGQVADAQGERQEARYLFRESLESYKEMGDRWGMAQALTNLAEVTGDHAAARRLFREAFTTAIEAQVIPTALDALVGLVALAAREIAAEPTLELLTQIVQHPAGSRAAKERAGRLRLELEVALAPHQVAAIREHSRERSFETVVEAFLRAG